MARLDPLETADINESYRHLIEAQSERPPPEYSHLAFDGDHHIFQTLAHNPGVLKSFRDMIDQLWDDIGLTAVQRELVILVVVRETRCAYVWHHHVRGALTIGMAPATIRAIAERRFDVLDAPEEAICEYAHAVAAGSVDDETWDALASAFDGSTMVGTTVLASFYLMVSSFLDAFDTELEGPFVGWNLAGL